MTAARFALAFAAAASLIALGGCSSDGTCVDPVGGSVTLSATPATSCLSLRATKRSTDILIEGQNACTVDVAIYPVRTDGGRDVLVTYKPGDMISYPTPSSTTQLTFFYGSESRTLVVVSSSPTSSNCR
jgi:hypothetical protein